MAQKEKTVFKHEPDHWVTVSIDSITDERLDYFDRCLLMYMTFRFNGMTEKGFSYFESTQTLADVFGVHRNTVSKAIQKFKEIGYVTVTTKVGGSNTYTNVTTWLNGVTPKKSKPKVEQTNKPAQTFTKSVPTQQKPLSVPCSWEDEDDPF